MREGIPLGPADLWGQRRGARLINSAKEINDDLAARRGWKSAESAALQVTVTAMYSDFCLQSSQRCGRNSVGSALEVLEVAAAAAQIVVGGNAIPRALISQQFSE